MTMTVEMFLPSQSPVQREHSSYHYRNPQQSLPLNHTDLHKLPLHEQHQKCHSLQENSQLYQNQLSHLDRHSQNNN